MPKTAFESLTACPATKTHLPPVDPPSTSALGPSSSTGLMPQRWHISAAMPHVTSDPTSTDVSRHTRLHVLVEIGMS